MVVTTRSKRFTTFALVLVFSFAFLLFFNIDPSLDYLRAILK